MKKAILILICALVLASASGCIKIYPAGDADATPTEKATEAPTEKPMINPTHTARPPKPSIKPIKTPAISMMPTSTETSTPSSTPAFYPSYADMVSFDPATGVAEFDYFDILKGQDAIDWMVAHEGYTLADATDIVNDWGDGQYWKKNTNPQLRAIDLDDYPLVLMYDPASVPAFEVGGIPSTTADAAALYALDPAYLFEHFFFYIHVDGDGNVTEVEQVYWC